MKTIEMAELYIANHKLAPLSVMHYRRAAANLAKTSEEWPTDKLTIMKWVASNAKYATMSMKSYYSAIKAIANFAVEFCGLPYPFPKRSPIHGKQPPRRYFSKSDLNKLIIQASKLERDKVLLAALMDSTCRIGELANLKPQNIASDHFTTTGKTGEVTHQCRPEICEALLKLSNGESIFQNSKGEPATATVLKHRFLHMVKAAGITGKKLGPHTIRHTMASLIAKSTGSVLAVKALLGHENIATSMVYIHDAEASIQQQLSPMSLIESPEGKGLSSQMALKPVEQPEQQYGVIDILELEYKEVPKDRKFYPIINSTEMELIRRAFIGYTKTMTSTEDNAMMRDLFNRFLRKTKA